MNAVSTTPPVRLGPGRSYTMLGINGSFRGLMDRDVRELQWGDVRGWSSLRGRRQGSAGMSRLPRTSMPSATAWRTSA